jgi:hypothetical protein
MVVTSYVLWNYKLQYVSDTVPCYTKIYDAQLWKWHYTMKYGSDNVSYKFAVEQYAC